ncbi:hypothetical protein ACHAQA_007942 [Verticillium albo-atrum]
MELCNFANISPNPSLLLATYPYSIPDLTMHESHQPLSELNRDFFDAHATALYEQDWVQALLRGQERFITANAGALGLSPVKEGQDVRLLDYACGNGAMSWTLQPYITTTRGIDVSSAMVAAFNAQASSRGFAESRAHAVQADLSSPVTEQPALLSTAEWREFDIVVVAMALHHLEDPRGMLGALAARVRPGGRLLVVEWLREEGDKAHGEHGTSEKPVTAHLVNDWAFTGESLEDWFRGAGCGEGFVAVVDEEKGHIPEEVIKVPGGVERQLIVASGVKAM